MELYHERVKAFLTNVAILYPPPPQKRKTPENQKLSGFRIYNLRTMAKNGLINIMENTE